MVFDPTVVSFELAQFSVMVPNELLSFDVLVQVLLESRVYPMAQAEHLVDIWLMQEVQGKEHFVQMSPLRKYPAKQVEQIEGSFAEQVEQ